MDILPVLEHIAPQALWIVIVMVIDLIIGVAAALKCKEFDAQKLPEILETYGLRMIGWLGLEFLVLIPEEFLVSAGITQLIGDGAMLLIIIGGVKSIIKSAGDLDIMPALIKK